MSITKVTNTPEGAEPRLFFDKVHVSENCPVADQPAPVVQMGDDADSRGDMLTSPDCLDGFEPPAGNSFAAQPKPDLEIFQHIRPLGIVRGKKARVYYVKATNEVVELATGRHTQSELLAIANLQAWINSFPVRNRKGEIHTGKFSLTRAVDALHRASERIGDYSASAVRGLGCWMDVGRVVVNAGSHLLVDGVPCSYNDLCTDFIYQPGDQLVPKGQIPATVAQSGQLLELCQSLSFRTKLEGELLAGWIALAPVCGILDWRPHGILTAGSGKGKTWVLDNIVGKALGTSVLRVAGRTTEAGLRQIIAHNNLPVVFDEAESESQDAADRMRGVFELMRVASNGNGQRVVKGSADGRYQDYNVRAMFLLAAVGVAAERKADRSRFTVFEFTGQKESKDAQAHFGRLCDLAQQSVEDPAYQAALLARLFKMAPVMRLNARMFSVPLAQQLGNRRVGDQLGALLAGAHALRSDGLVTEAEAAAIVASHDWTPFVADVEETDESHALQRLLDYPVRINNTTTMLVGDMIREMLTRSKTPIAGHYSMELAKIGIKVTPTYVAVAKSHAALEQVYRDTPFLKNWSMPLLRLAGAAKKKGERIGGSQRNCVIIPHEAFAANLAAPDEPGIDA